MVTDVSFWGELSLLWWVILFQLIIKSQYQNHQAKQFLCAISQTTSLHLFQLPVIFDEKEMLGK